MLWSLRRHSTVAFALLLLLGYAPSAHATPIMMGSVTVTETETGFSPTSQSATIGAGPEISGNDGTDIGDGILFTGEYIDIGSSSIVFNIFGGDTADGPYPTGYLGTAYGADAAYTFSGISFDDPLAQITGLTYSLTNIVKNDGTSTGTTILSPADLSFTGNSITLGIGVLDVRNSLAAGDLGQLTINVQTNDSEPPPPPVPEPSSLSLLGLGLMGGWKAYRRRRAA